MRPSSTGEGKSAKAAGSKEHRNPNKRESREQQPNEMWCFKCVCVCVGVSGKLYSTFKPGHISIDMNHILISICCRLTDFTFILCFIFEITLTYNELACIRSVIIYQTPFGSNLFVRIHNARTSTFRSIVWFNFLNFHSTMKEMLLENWAQTNSPATKWTTTTMTK